MTDRKTMIAELGRRRPAAADDVDAILAMPRSDAVNEGLLAELRRHERDYPSLVHGLLCGQAADEIERLRAVPSPGTVGVREALEEARSHLVSNRQLDADRAIARALAALSTHCTSARREEIDFSDPLTDAIMGAARLHTHDHTTALKITADVLIAIEDHRALSEQSGPTAGMVLAMGGENSSWHGHGRIEVREAGGGESWAWRYITDHERQYLIDCLNRRITPSPPDRQQDPGK